MKTSQTGTDQRQQPGPENWIGCDKRRTNLDVAQENALSVRLRAPKNAITIIMPTTSIRHGISRSTHRALRASAALLLIWAAGANADTPIRSIDIVQNPDGFTANVVMFAPVPPSVAWAVLTDFDHMAGWVPNVRDSKVTASEGNALTVEQQGVAKFGLLSFPYTSVRQMVLDPQRTVHAKQIKGSMRRLESLMKVSPDGNGTQLNYHLELVPAGLAAAVLSKEFLEHELTEQFSAIIQEMVRRNR